jgi:hypothetical protein
VLADALTAKLALCEAAERSALIYVKDGGEVRWPHRDRWNVRCGLMLRITVDIAPWQRRPMSGLSNRMHIDSGNLTFPWPDHSPAATTANGVADFCAIVSAPSQSAGGRSPHSPMAIRRKFAGPS